MAITLPMQYEKPDTENLFLDFPCLIKPGRKKIFSGEMYLQSKLQKLPQSSSKGKLMIF